MNYDWAQDWLIPFVAGDMDKVLSMYHDDADVKMLNGRRAVADKEAIKDLFINFCNVYPESERGSHYFYPTQYYGTEEAGVIPFRWIGKTGNEFMGIPTEVGQPIDIMCYTCHTYRDGKIATEVSYWDPLALWRQWGVWDRMLKGL